MLSTRHRPLCNLLILLLLVLFTLYSLRLAKFRTPKVALGPSDGSFFDNTRLALENERVSSGSTFNSLSHNIGQLVPGKPQFPLPLLSLDSHEPDVINKIPKAEVPNGEMNDRNHFEAERATERTMVESQNLSEAENELRRILRISPIVIFSKSTCPYSTRAKEIMLKKYSIYPAPFVLELDQHSLGLSLQKSLTALTGRSTVPNVLIYGQSIGGGDEVTGLDQKHILASKILELGRMNIKVHLRETN